MYIYKISKKHTNFIETVAYACQSHDQKLPGRDGQRRGFFLGDGAGKKYLCLFTCNCMSTYTYLDLSVSMCYILGI